MLSRPTSYHRICSLKSSLTRVSGVIMIYVHVMISTIVLLIMDSTLSCSMRYHGNWGWLLNSCLLQVTFFSREYPSSSTISTIPISSSSSPKLHRYPEYMSRITAFQSHCTLNMILTFFHKNCILSFFSSRDIFEKSCSIAVNCKTRFGNAFGTGLFSFFARSKSYLLISIRSKTSS